MIRLKRLAFVFALIAVMCITAAPVRADTANIPVAISTDYSFLVAGLGPVVPGSPYQWTVDGVVAMEGAAEETFFLAADRNMQPARGKEPSSQKGISYVEGRFGKAFLAPASGISFPAADAVDLRQGTIEFWVSPRLDGNSPEYTKDQAMFSYKASNGDELLVRQAHTGIICAQVWVGGEYMSAYSDIGDIRGWKAGSWHHVAFAFSEEKNFMRMYVDGRPAGDTNEGSYRPPKAAAAFFQLGNPHYAMDSVRITREVFDLERTTVEFSRRSAPLPGEVLFPLTGILSGADIVVQFGEARGAFRYPGLPLAQPQPGSALLPAGTTKLDLEVKTPEPAEVRWSVNGELPFEQMTPFTEGSGGTIHRTTINGLSADPATVNRVYIRSSKAVDYQLELKYRSVPALKADYPRISNLWSWRLTEDEYKDYTSKLQLAVPAYSDPDTLRRIRAVNPDIVLLATLQPLEYFFDEPPIPDDYYLKDVSGQRIVYWPGAYHLNMTKPEVVAFNAKRLRETMLNADLLFDGAFIDSFILEPSLFTKDAYGKPVRIDADNNGVPDDPETLDAAWRAGMLEMVRIWRESMPGVYATGHLSAEADELGSFFDGDNLAFICVEAIEGRTSFGYAWSRYHGWEAGGSGPNITVIDTGAPSELGYGYGVYSSFDAAERRIPADVLEFARTWYPTVRFGLAFALMGNGLYEHHFSDVLYCEEWWYDEFDFRLGKPLGPAYYVPVAGSDVSSPKLVFSEDFESASARWKIGTGEGAKAEVSYVNDAASGRRAASVDVRVLPKKGPEAFYNVCFYHSDLKVKKGHNYRISFSAKASSPRMMVASLQKRSGNWEGAGFWDRVSLEEEWRDFEMRFTATIDSTDTGLQFFMGDTLGTVLIDNVKLEELPPDVYRRDFEQGIVLLNGTAERQKVSLGKGYSRIVGSQAPRWQYIKDDDGEVLYKGQWKATHYDTPEWKPDPPFYHDWGSSCRESADAGAYADYDLAVPEDGTYTVKVWLPEAPNRAKRTTAALYEIVSEGKVIASAKLDQTKSPDTWQTVATVTLRAGDKPQLRLRNEGVGILYADAVYVESEARYNDGSEAKEVTLEPFDGILLNRSK